MGIIDHHQSQRRTPAPTSPCRGQRFRTCQLIVYRFLLHTPKVSAPPCTRCAYLSEQRRFANPFIMCQDYGRLARHLYYRGEPDPTVHSGLMLCKIGTHSYFNKFSVQAVFMHLREQRWYSTQCHIAFSFYLPEQKMGGP